MNLKREWPVVYVECSPGCRVCRALAEAAANDRKGRTRPVRVVPRPR